VPISLHRAAAHDVNARADSAALPAIPRSRSSPLDPAGCALASADAVLAQ
jgi:hypothetical protein